MTTASAADVSMIVPVRNEAETLGDFLTSLLRQLPTPREIVLVDAGSTDGTGDILRRYTAADGRLRVVEAEAAYPGRARNMAIGEAQGPWIAMTDAGTIVDEGWLRELTATAAREPDAAAILGTYEPLMRTFFDTCVALAFVAPGRSIDGRRFRGPSTASMMIRKQTWQELGGFPEDLRACEDLVFFERLERRGYPVACAPRATVKWRIPGTFGALFQRFRAYSQHTLRAGRAHHWHRPVAWMYAAAAVAVVLAVAVHWIFALVPVAGLILRTHRSIEARRDIADSSNYAVVPIYAMTALILVSIDIAALAGTLDFVRSRGRQTWS